MTVLRTYSHTEQHTGKQFTIPIRTPLISHITLADRNPSDMLSVRDCNLHCRSDAVLYLSEGTVDRVLGPGSCTGEIVRDNGLKVGYRFLVSSHPLVVHLGHHKIVHVDSLSYISSIFDYLFECVN